MTLLTFSLHPSSDSEFIFWSSCFCFAFNFHFRLVGCLWNLDSCKWICFPPATSSEREAKRFTKRMAVRRRVKCRWYGRACNKPKKETSRVCELGAFFKLDHLQPVRLILSHKFSIFLSFILGGPIPYYPRERKKGSSRGRKWGKGNHPKVNEKQGFLYLGHSNWTICSLLS